MKKLLTIYRLLPAVPRNQSGGFSLIEMMVSLSIVAIISGIILFSYPTFSSQLVLNNLAHEIALTIREAQVFGIGTREFEGGFPQSYGVFFTTSAPERFVLFADTGNPGNGLYDGGSPPNCTGECIQIFSLRRNNQITQLAVEDSGGNYDSKNRLDITFTRPSPEATIYANSITGGDYPSARITISAPNKETRQVTVYTNGQISVE